MNARDEPVRVVMEIDAGVESETIAESESFQLCRKIFRVRHRRVIYEDGDNGNAALQSARYFESDKIRRIIDPAVRCITASGPIRSNYRHDDFGALQRLLDMFAEINAVRNGIEIHEDIAFAEFGLEAVIKPAGHWTRVLPPI